MVQNYGQAYHIRPKCNVRDACSVRDAKITFQIFLYKMYTFHMDCMLNGKEKLNAVIYRPWCLISSRECMNHIFVYLAITSPGLWGQIRGIILGSKIKFFCVAQKTTAHERVEIKMYATKILLSYLWYLSSSASMKKPNLTSISALQTLHIITYIFVGPPLTISFHLNSSICVFIHT